MSNSDLIKQYCVSLDGGLLDRLDRTCAITFQKFSAYALTQPGTRHDIARRVLRHFNLDDAGRRVGLVDRGRAKAEGYVTSMSVAMTGARPGDTLVGTSKGTKGAVMLIHDEPVPPQQRTLDAVRYYPELWERFLVKLGSVPFFAKMSTYAREIWLEVNEQPNENSIGQEGSRLEIIQPGTGLFAEKLSESDLDRLVQGNPDSADGFWTYKEIEDMIPRKGGSRAVRHTLVLIRTFWKIAVDYEVTEATAHLTIDIAGCRLTQGYEASEEQEIFVVGSVARHLKKTKQKWARAVGPDGVQSIGLVVSKSRMNFAQMDDLIQSILPTDVRAIRASMKNFTGASFKSLMQKLVRFRPTQVDIGRGKLHSAQSVLLVAMTELAKHPGAFVPDIQRYVTGLESFTKRLAIIVYEDSYIPEDMMPYLLSLLAASMTAQRIKTWVPDRELLTTWLMVGLKAWEETTAVKTDFHAAVKREPYVLTYGQTFLQSASAVLDDLRSFDTDLGLARAWAADYPDFTLERAVTTPDIMPIGSCVDQHWAPQVAHYFDPEFLFAISEGHSTSEPFKQLFNMMWNTTSSINPRRDHLDFTTFEKQNDVIHIRNAQKLFLMALQSVQHPREDTDEIFEMRYTLNDAWLAGLVGAIEVTPAKHPAMLVTMSGDDPLELIVVRRPSRNMIEDPLTPEAEAAAIRLAKQKLRAGVPLNKAHPPDQSFVNGKVFLVETEESSHYEIQRAKGMGRVTWDIAKQLEIALPTHTKVPWSIKNALIRVGNGVQEGAAESLEELIRATDPKVVRRMLVYISTYSHDIEMNRISRDGGGTYKAVTLEDTPAYQLMLRLSLLYPAAIAPNGPSKFVVGVGPLLWEIREKISKSLAGHIDEDNMGWQQIRFSDDSRKMRSYQREIVDDMVENHNKGDKGNFIWVPVGLGKTKSVFEYLRVRKEKGTLPPYVIYTLPESAIKSIIQEIKYFGIPINLIFPLADIKKRKAQYAEEGVTIAKSCAPVPFAINLIEHDHLRRCEDVFNEYASRSMFVVDEVHKTLNDTKRTSVALEMAHLSLDFIVLTGTPIIDNNTYKLIGWLEQVVPYEVNTRNFWVAANSMIAKKVNTGIQIVREDVVALFDKDEEKSYTSLVPPALGGTNVKPSHEEWMAATEICYQAADKEMMTQVEMFLQEDRGVMLVAKDKRHQQKLYVMLTSGTSVNPEDVYVLGSGESIFLTDEAVAAGKIRNYKVVIVTIKKAEGYTLTALSAMVTSVYPSNNAQLTQIEGRINRVSQQRSEIDYRTVHCGILTIILQNHKKAKNLEIALAGLAKEIDMPK
jgi:superfamily II DNA or RNA helicase